MALMYRVMPAVAAPVGRDGPKPESPRARATGEIDAVCGPISPTADAPSAMMADPPQVLIVCGWRWSGSTPVFPGRPRSSRCAMPAVADLLPRGHT
jgi:hypothetical protein